MYVTLLVLIWYNGLLLGMLSSEFWIRYSFFCILSSSGSFFSSCIGILSSEFLLLYASSGLLSSIFLGAELGILLLVLLFLVFLLGVEVSV